MLHANRQAWLPKLGFQQQGIILRLSTRSLQNILKEVSLGIPVEMQANTWKIILENVDFLLY